MSANNAKLTLPTDSAERKQYPLLGGCLKYFPAALAGIARISKVGNDKHNPGLPLHHARGLSMDHGDCVIRHLIDTEDLLAALNRKAEVSEELKNQILAEVSQMAWRALAYSQMLHEKFGAPLAPGADERLLKQPALPTAEEYFKSVVESENNSPSARAGIGPTKALSMSFSEALKQNYGEVVAETKPVNATKQESVYAGTEDTIPWDKYVYGDTSVQGFRDLVNRFSVEDHIVARDAIIDEAAGIGSQMENAVKNGFKIP